MIEKEKNSELLALIRELDFKEVYRSVAPWQYKFKLFNKYEEDRIITLYTADTKNIEKINKYITKQQNKISQQLNNIAFYKHCNFSMDENGYEVFLKEGKYLDKDLQQAGIASKDISSLRIPVGLKVMLFKKDAFTGESITLSSDVQCLSDFQYNDSTLSLIISKDTTNFSATVYNNCCYGGNSAKFTVGKYNLEQMRKNGIENDDISSILLPPNYEIILFQHDEFKGDSVVVNKNCDCLYDYNWDNNASSLILRKQKK